MPPRKRRATGENVVPIRARKVAKTPEAKARQAEAGRKNLAKGRAARKERVEHGPEHEKSRWKMLCDGDIAVTDLDDEELSRMQTRDRYGGFAGRPPQVARKLVQAMKAESIRRAQTQIDAAVGKAVKLLVEVVDSKEAGLKDRLKASELLMARGMGSVPTHIINHEGTKWDDMINDDDQPVVVMYEEGTAG